jgi:hypothetical protein
MGDSKRFQILAEFIRRNYPGKERVLDVAGGQGNLSIELVKRGYECEIIDPRKSIPSREEKEICRRIGRSIPRIRRLYEVGHSIGFDLIVGLHPDGATREICRTTKIKDIVLVPCCNYWKPGLGNVEQFIENYLRSEKTRFNLTALPMGGRNSVYFTKNF